MNTNNQRYRTTAKIAAVVRKYHRHSVHGLNFIPRRGGALIVVNHSLATYDIFLLAAAIYEGTGRIVRPLLDRLFFKLPVIRDWTRGYGGVPGSPQIAKKLLLAGELVTVAPGGMREALRPAAERYQILWHDRLGFARIAMQTRVPIILAACPKADDLYDVYPSHTTNWFYQQLKVPVFLARGLGLSLLPRPVVLTHYVSAPIEPPPLPDDPVAAEAAVVAFHSVLVQRMTELMQEAVVEA